MMKKSVGLLLVLVLASSLVLAAGESYDLEDFKKSPMQGIVVGEYDEVRFNLFNATHTIVFTSVKDVGFRFTGYGYMDDDFKIQGFATKKWSSYIDVNRDNVSDMNIAFYDYKIDEETNETYATVIFKVDDNAITTHAVSESDDSGIIKEASYSRYLTTIGVIAFVLLLVIIARRGNNKKKGIEPAENKAVVVEETEDKPAEE
ncbi:MAG: hypothetical protein V1914_03490 [archaeon]